jgi:hypothetical protein
MEQEKVPNEVIFETTVELSAKKTDILEGSTTAPSKIKEEHKEEEKEDEAYGVAKPERHIIRGKIIRD